MTTQEQIKHQHAILSTLQFMTIQAERIGGHADIVGDGEQMLLTDDLRALLTMYGLKAEEVDKGLRSGLDTQDDMEVVAVEQDQLDTSETSK